MQMQTRMRNSCLGVHACDIGFSALEPRLLGICAGDGPEASFGDAGAADASCAGPSDHNPNPSPRRSPAPVFYDPYAPLDPLERGTLPLRPFRKGRPPKPRAPKAPPADALGCAPWAVPSLPAAAGALTFMEFECALSQDGREECMHAWG